MKTTPGHIRITDEMYERLHPTPPRPKPLTDAELAKMFRPIVMPDAHQPLTGGFSMGRCPHCGGLL